MTSGEKRRQERDWENSGRHVARLESPRIGACTKRTQPLEESCVTMVGDKT